jgi:hypothetical protein
MSYTLTQEEYRRLKTRLTTRVNRLNKLSQPVRDVPSLPKPKREDLVKEANQLIAECAYAQGIFDTKGSPDDWSRWERAKEDAQSLIQRAQPTW